MGWQARTKIRPRLSLLIHTQRPRVEPFPSELSDAEFLMANQGLVAKLRQMHPESPEADLVRALRQVGGKKEPSGQARVIRAGLLLDLMREQST
jgi:hypothetical protein